MDRRDKPDYIYKEAWARLHNVFGEQMRQDELDLMDSVMLSAVSDDSDSRLALEYLGALQGHISYWESILFHDSFLLSPSVQYIIENTVECLKSLQKATDSAQICHRLHHQ